MTLIGPILVIMALRIMKVDVSVSKDFTDLDVNHRFFSSLTVMMDLPATTTKMNRFVTAIVQLEDFNIVDSILAMAAVLENALNGKMG